MKTFGNISIIVPTNRSIELVHGTIRNIKNIATTIEAELIVSDNRGDAKKSNVLSNELGGSYFKSPESGAVGNFFYALRKSSKRFTWSLHDDDWVFDLGGAFPKRLPSDCVGICPIILLTSPAHGIYGVRNFDLCQIEPTDRIKAYASQSAGANSLLFAIWETDLLQNLYQALETHPCHAGYQDWTFVKACLAEGKVISSDRFGYKYNNNNWYGPPASNLEELEDLMRRADLPVELAQKLGLLNIIDLICLFGRNRGYRATIENRLTILDAILVDQISGYKREFLMDYLGQSIEFIRRLSCQAGERYQIYVETVLGTTKIGSQP